MGKLLNAVLLSIPMFGTHYRVVNEPISPNKPSTTRAYKKEEVNSDSVIVRIKYFRILGKLKILSVKFLDHTQVP